MTDRRFSDDDARRILSLAAEAEAAAPVELPWTLGELQRIGAEAGLSPAAIATAALAVERSEAAAPERRLLGLPVAVGHAVPLARPMSDEEWERLVGRLRDTFSSEGRVRVTGTRREWRVGNLRVTHETMGDGGALLDLRTRKGDAASLPTFGALVLLGSATAGALGLAGADAGLTLSAAVGAVSGALVVAMSALRLPRWARERTRQFESVADFARRLSAKA